MKSRLALFILLAALLVPMISATAPVQAASRTWVASNGNDSNPCTRAAPCATLATAYTNTDAFGEINCVDAGSYGGSFQLIIQKSITISCETGTAGVLAPASVYAIGVNVAETDVVILRGLDINGLGGALNSSRGILFAGAGTLRVEKCQIRGFQNTTTGGDGIYFFPSGHASLTVSDSIISDNGSAAHGGSNITTALNGSPGFVKVSLKNVQMLNGAVGFQVIDDSATTIHAVIEDSLANGNIGDGFLASTTGGRLTMLIDRSTAANNGQNGIEAVGANAEVDVGNSRLYGNTGSTAISGGGPALLSFGNNEIVGNGRNSAIATTSTQ